MDRHNKGRNEGLRTNVLPHKDKVRKNKRK